MRQSNNRTISVKSKSIFVEPRILKAAAAGDNFFFQQEIDSLSEISGHCNVFSLETLIKIGEVNS